jgi:hypothetical protein
MGHATHIDNFLALLPIIHNKPTNLEGFVNIREGPQYLREAFYISSYKEVIQKWFALKQNESICVY